MMCAVRERLNGCGLKRVRAKKKRGKKLLLHGFENRLSLIAQVIALSIESDCFIYTLPLMYELCA